MVKAHLLKWCKLEHRLPDAEFLRIGSLADFRSTHSHEIRDEAEGDYLITVDFEDAFLTSEQMSRLFPGAMSFDGYSSKLTRRTFSFFGDELSMQRVDGDLHRVSVRARYKTVENSSLVFCMTHGAFGMMSPFLGYNSVWLVNGKFAQEFADVLLREVRSLPLEELIDLRTVFGAVPAEEVVLEIDHGPVSYVDRHYVVRNADEKIISELEARLSNCEFFKPEAYAKEREYRFVIRARFGDHYLAFLKKHVLIDAQAFRVIPRRK